jgi:hypothetical protein
VKDMVPLPYFARSKKRFTITEPNPRATLPQKSFFITPAETMKQTRLLKRERIVGRISPVSQNYHSTSAFF